MMPDPSPCPVPAPRVLIVDDHPIVLYGLRFAIEREDRFTVCDEAGDALLARHLAATLRPDYIIVDLVLGGRDGVELVRDLAGSCPNARILVYSSQPEARYARRVLAAGARGFVAKSEGLNVVMNALGTLARGEIFIGDTLTRRLIDDFIDAPDAADAAIDALSERERQVLRLIGEGRTTAEMADELKLSIKTIGTYRDRLRAKLALESARDLEIWTRDRPVT